MHLIPIQCKYFALDFLNLAKSKKMAYSLHANIRYRVIDRCLKDYSRTYFHDELADAIADEFYELGLKLDKPSKRTIDYDISNMRSGRLGYEAPIAFTKSDGYRYSDPNFSLFKLSLNRQAVHDLTQTLLLMKQMPGIESMPVVSRSITLLEQELQIKAEGKKPIIYFEESTNDDSKPWISVLYEKIRRKQTISIQYQPFRSSPKEILLAPYSIYEFNHRYYVVGWGYEDNQIAFVSLDRISEVTDSIRPYLEIPGFDIRTYMAETYGVRRPDKATPQTIIFKVSNWVWTDIKTKPIHRSQKLIEESFEFNTYQLDVILNDDIRHRLLSFGSNLVVLEPRSLREDMIKELKEMVRAYGVDTEELYRDDSICYSIAISDDRKIYEEPAYRNKHVFYD